MRVSKISLFTLFVGASLFAQKQNFTMAEAVNGLRTNLAVKNIQQFKWLENGQYSEAVKNAYLLTDTKTMKKDTLLSLYQINKNLAKDKQLKALPYLTFTNAKQAYFSNKGEYFTLNKDLTGNWNISTWTKLSDNSQNITLAKDNSFFVYTNENNLFINKNGKNIAITSDADKNILNGQAVHRNEFGIDKGIFIAPDNKKVAFYKMNQTMVADYPMIDWSLTPAVNENIKYPMAGKKSHQVSIGVYDVASGKTNFLNIEGDKEQYLTAVSWSPDAKYIFVGVLNREQNHLKMNQYNANDGSFVKTLFEETDDKYVEPQHPMMFFPNSLTDYIWQSQRSGYNHLYHYNLEKGLISQITKGNWVVTDVLGFNEKKKEIYYQSTQETPLERHLYKVNWANFKTQKLDNAAGMHFGMLNDDGSMIYEVYSGKDCPRSANLINTSNQEIQNLLTAENPLKNYNRPQVKNFELKADDGTPLYGKIILPTDFDANKKYPAIVYLYNGPHFQLVTNAFPESGNLWYEYMAQHGYVVLTMDGRGSSNRGKKFEQVTFRNLGETEMKDQLKGVEYLKSLSYVDAQKLGIHGWSFGGFMTTSFMLKYPDVFKVGVAGGPVIDWNMYEIMYTERYMDTPQENPEGYKKAGLLDKVQNLKGKLLMIHGAQDDVVVLQHSIKFLKSAVDNGVQLDYFVYPGHPHNVLGKDRVHLMQKITDYFDEYLK